MISSLLLIHQTALEFKPMYYQPQCSSPFIP